MVRPALSPPSGVVAIGAAGAHKGDTQLSASSYLLPLPVGDSCTSLASADASNETQQRQSEAVNVDVDGDAIMSSPGPATPSSQPGDVPQQISKHSKPTAVQYSLPKQFHSVSEMSSLSGDSAVSRERSGRGCRVKRSSGQTLAEAIMHFNSPLPGFPSAHQNGVSTPTGVDAICGG